MRIAIALLSCASLLACTTARTTYLPSGREGYLINCSGGAQSWGSCQARAGEICRDRGYDIISAEQDKSPLSVAQRQATFNTLTTAQQASASGTAHAIAYAGTKVTRTMLIACR